MLDLDDTRAERKTFLRCLDEVEPSVLRSLREEVFPIYQKAIAESRRIELEALTQGLNSIPDSSNPPLPMWALVDTQLQHWAANWHLSDEWILMAAMHTMGSWDYEVLENVARRPGWLGPRTVYVMPREQQFVFEHPGWEIGKLSRSEALASIRRTFTTTLVKYLKQMDEIARSRGYQPPREKRMRSAATLEVRDHNKDQHYRWLAEWQIRDTNWKTIAAKASVTSDAVRMAVKQTAKDIGLTLRPKPRRPNPVRGPRRGPRN